jgi:YcaO-like protein with predicted kinase domain
MSVGAIIRARGSARKGFLVGAHRVLRPAETLEKILPLMPVFGITRVANITGLDVVGIPVVMVSRPNARSLSVAQGKGFDIVAAKTSGLMEAIETYHAEHITLPLKFATFNEMRSGHRLVDVDRLARLALSPFHADLRLLWIEGLDLLQDASVWLPYETVHMDYTLPFPPGSGCFVATSSGLASGNHVLEAISHGICELVERDANALWHAARERALGETRVDLSTIDDPICVATLERLVNAKVLPAVWETTSDTGIPSFYCAIVDEKSASWRASYPCSGSGCHPTREIALSRALTEAAQSRLTMIAGSRDDTARSDYRHAGDPEAADRIRSILAGNPPVRSFRTVPTFVGYAFEEDVEWLLGRLLSSNCHSVVVIDLTRRDLNVSVVRVVIPGLESSHDIPGYVPGLRARAAMAAAPSA